MKSPIVIFGGNVATYSGCSSGIVVLRDLGPCALPDQLDVIDHQLHELGVELDRYALRGIVLHDGETLRLYRIDPRAVTLSADTGCQERSSDLPTDGTLRHQPRFRLLGLRHVLPPYDPVPDTVADSLVRLVERRAAEVGLAWSRGIELSEVWL